ncbi:MAG: hypothetical protein RLZZ326_1653 [Planctomycetota bacterium]|jgi:hypothetical protein
MSPTNRTQSRFSSPCPLDQRLLAYALGGGALALVAAPAGATPISSGIQNITFASSGPTAATETTQAVNLVPGDATSPVFNLTWAILNGGVDGTAPGVATATQTGPGTFSFYTSSIFANNNFAPGATVGATPGINPYPKYNSFGFNAVYDATGAWVAQYTSGLTLISNWTAGGSGYVGFSFQDSNSDPHYGWMEMIVPTTSAQGQDLALVQWAWESDANTAITIPGGAAVPEIDPAAGASAAALALGGLALLEQQLGFAAGAVGLRAWRKRRQALAA